MIYKTELRGRFVKDDLFSLKVLSLHKGIINLLDQKNNYLISLIEDIMNMTGLSLLVPEFFSQPGNGLSPGDTVSIDELGINYRDADQWTGFVPSNSEKNLRSETDILSLFGQIQTDNNLFGLLTDHCETAFQKKAQNILEHDITVDGGIIKGLENLVGLGQGMTPSGDDFITGALLSANRNISIKIDKSAIERNLGKTTYAGRTLLYLALNESFPAYLLTFLEEKDVMSAIENASLHGATSGMDSLAGFYWFMQFLV